MNKDFELRKQMGNRITSIRTELNMTKEALAKELGITGQFLGVVENGKSDISYDKLKKLCDISGYSADYILFGRDSKKISKTRKKINDYSEEQICEACEIIEKIAIFIKNNSSKK